MKIKRLAALLLSGVMAASMLIGCGSVNKDAVVATFDETEIKLGIANFAARLQQASADDFYVAYFGAEVWSSDLYGNGTTMESSMKDSVMQNLFDLYTLEAHMVEYDVELTEDEKTAITQAASDFMAANDKEALDALGAEQEIVEEYLTLMTIQDKMYDAIIADVDTNVSDEEANTSAYSYVRVAKDSYTDDEGNVVAYTEEELTELAETLEAFVTEAQEDTLETVAESYGYTVSTGTFTAEDETLNETVLTTLKGLDEGEISGVIDTETNYYIVRLDAKTDAEATELTRQNIISERESTLYADTLSGWESEHEWTVKEKVWETVTFDNLFTTYVETAETEAVEATEQ